MSKPDVRTEGESATPSAAAQLRLLLAQDLSQVALLSTKLEKFLTAAGIREEDTLSIRIAVTEACNNAVQHAISADPIEINVQIGANTVVISILDHTAGFQWPEAINLPPPEAERGRGLFLINEVMDSVDYHREHTGNRLVLTRRLVSAPGK